LVPQFLPDGRHFLFSALTGDSGSALNNVLYVGSLDSTSATRLMDLDSIQPDSFSRPANGGGSDALLLASDEGELLIPEDWSADGRYIIFRRVKISATAKIEPDLWALPLFGDRKPFPVVQSPAVKGFARLSTDGRWLAHATNESGPFAVVVQPFPDTSKGKWQVSTGAAGEVMWRRDGRELFYRAEGKLMAVSIRSGDVFEKDWFLFNTRNTRSASETTSASVPITAVVNWTGALDKR
jgi:hypothetical protein